MDTVLIKLMKPLPELFGYRHETPYCFLAEEASEGETIVGLLRKLAGSHPDFEEIVFKPVKGGSAVVWHLNGRIAPLTSSIRGGDIISVFVGGG